MKTWKWAFALAAAIAAGAAESALADLQYLDETGAPATVQSYTGVRESDYIWSTGWYAVTNNVTVEGRLYVEGTVNLVLCDGAKLTANNGIEVTIGNAFNVFAQSDGDDMGAIEAMSPHDKVAAIGGANITTAGEISIYGGHVKANAKARGAAIGGGQPSSTQPGGDATIMIAGGFVEAYGSSGAAIGCAASSSGDNTTITITGGRVSAVSTGAGAAIGAGWLGGSSGLTINISGGIVSATVTDQLSGGAAIGNGYGQAKLAGPTVNISGGEVHANGVKSIGGTFHSPGNNHSAGNITITGGRVFASGEIGSDNFSDPTKPSSISISLSPGDFVVAGNFVARNITLGGDGYVLVRNGQPPVLARADNVAGGGQIVSPDPSLPFPACLAGDGTAASPYAVQNAAQWDALAAVAAGSFDTSGVHVCLLADIAVTNAMPRFLGGTFDGGGHTLTVDLNAANGIAPFWIIGGTTIRNLKVAGTVSGARHCAGLASGINASSNLIENCEVSASVTTSDIYCGGFVGHGGSFATTIRGCVFSGSLHATTADKNFGTFWGWSDAASPTIVDCLDQSGSAHPVGRSAANATVSVANVFHVGAEKSTGGHNPWTGDSAGVRAYEISFASAGKFTLAGGAVEYGVGRLAFLDGPVVRRGESYYAPGGATVSMSLPSGYEFGGMTLDGAPVAAEGGSASFAMPSANAAVAFSSHVSSLLGGGGACDPDGSAERPYVISSAEGWNLFCDCLDDDSEWNGFSGKTVRLAADISVARSAGSSAHPFRGTFDGAGHTLDVSLSSASQGCAPFGCVVGATIRKLRTTGTVTLASADAYHASGLVGHAVGVTIDKCRASVKIEYPSGSAKVHSGGLVGHAHSSPFTITDSLFDGGIVGSENLRNVGGLVGWDDASTPYIANCLNAGTFSNPGVISKIGRVDGRGTIDNCYSTVSATSSGDRNDNRGTYTTATGAELCGMLGLGWTVDDGGCVVPDCAALPHDGASYLVGSTADWDNFAAIVASGKSFAGQTVKLAADNVLVTNLVGSSEHPFCGTFDGQGLAINLSLSGSEYCVAPFSVVSGATIRNLKVVGTVSGGMHSTGLVGLTAGGTNEIVNCEVAAAIASTGTHCGGFVGHAGGVGLPGATTLRGCVFSGSLPEGKITVGTFIGWGDNKQELAIALVDCLDKSESRYLVGYGKGTVSVSNTYYTAAGKQETGDDCWAQANRGKRAYRVTAGGDAHVGLGSVTTAYGFNGVSACEQGLRHAGTLYAAEGESVHIAFSGIPPFGKAYDGFAADVGVLSENGGSWTLTMPASDVVVNVVWRPVWKGAGTADDPYQIGGEADWSALADALNGGADTVGAHLLLTTNVAATTMVGSSANPFQGVFDGGGNTLSVELAGVGAYVAPFSAISGATISNLVVVGTVSGGMHCSGLVGSIVGGANTIADCEVAAAIVTSGSHCGGFVGHGGSFATAVRGCVFSGSISGGSAVGTLFGWADSPVVEMTDCLDASASPHPVGRSGGRVSVANVYFLADKSYGVTDRLWISSNRGKRAYRLTAGENVSLGYGEALAVYPATGLASYAPGLARGGVRYAAEGETVAFGIDATPPEGMALDGYSASAGTLALSGDDWTLAFPAADVVVSATFSHTMSLEGSGTADEPYRVNTAAEWDKLGELAALGVDTEGFHFRLISDVVVTTSVGTVEHPFSGVFDGGGRTITASLNGGVSAPCLAPFSAISGATISNLVVAGAVNGGAHSAGLVGYVSGGTNLIENCLVSAAIDARAPWCAGFVGDGGNSGATTLAGCVFTGSLSSTEGKVAWFWGGSEGPDPATGAPGADVTLVDCFEKSINIAPIGRGEAASLRVVNVYRDTMTDNIWPEGKRGLRAHSVTAAEGVEIDFGECAATYATSGIVAYGTGLAYGGVFYAGANESVSLSLASTTGGEPAFAVEKGDLARNGDSWKLTMPDEDVVVLPEPPKRYDIAAVADANATVYGMIRVDDVSTNSFAAKAGASVLVQYQVAGLSWAVSSASVVTENGDSVPCTAERWGISSFAVRFTMPAASVVVTPTVVPADYPVLQLGANDVSNYWFHVFVAPTNGVYSFDFAGAPQWEVSSIFDPKGLALQMSYDDTARLATMAAGTTNYVLVTGTSASSLSTLTVAKVRDVSAYPVVVAPSDHGTVVASCSESPEGCSVYLTVLPDRGWELAYVSAADSDGNPLYPWAPREETLWCVQMPAGQLTVSATFVRSRKLDIGETTILFERNMRPCTFVAPEDGWYRMGMTNAEYISYIDVVDASGNDVDFSYDIDAEGNLDGIFLLEAGSGYDIYFGYDRDVAIEEQVFVSRSEVHGIAMDANVAHGSASALDADLAPVAEAWSGSRVYLLGEPDDGYSFGGWSVVDATGEQVPLMWDYGEDLSYFRMPGTNVVVSATFGLPRRVRLGSTAQVRLYELFINGREVYTWSGCVELPPGGEVAATYQLCPGWDVTSFAVTTTDGESVPYTVVHDSRIIDFATLRFRMPESDVAVAIAQERQECPWLYLGTNVVDAAGFWDFVAPTSGVYLFTVADSRGCRLALFDDGGYVVDETWRSDTASITLAAGELCHAVVAMYTEQVATTVTVARVADAAVNSVTVLPPERGGTVVANCSEAAAGSYVHFTLTPDAGWELSDCVATDSDGNEVHFETIGPGLLCVRMPEKPLVFEALFQRDRELRIGENPVLFEKDMPDYYFTAPGDGWYRFRTTCGKGLMGFRIYGNGHEISFDSVHEDDGNWDGTAWLNAGTRCQVCLTFEPWLEGAQKTVEASIVVSKGDVHGIYSDFRTAHGRVMAVDANDSVRSEAPEGACVRLYCQPDAGYALEAWDIADANGEPVAVHWKRYDDFWYFKMPGTNVTVSARFGKFRSVTLDTATGVMPGDVVVNGQCETYFDTPRRAVPGADVFATYWLCPGWTMLSFSVTTASGASVPSDMEFVWYDGYLMASVRFEMPDENVVVSPVPVRAECPSLHVGDNAVATEGIWDFVAPTSGVYSFSFAASPDWHFQLYDDWGLEIIYPNEGIALAKGEVVHADIVRYEGEFESVLTIAKGGEPTAHPVVVNAKHATVVADRFEAFEGRDFAFLLVPDPGWELAEIVATDADGDEVELESMQHEHVFRMPGSAVTVTAEFVPAPPWYLEDADESIWDKYEDWASRYGADPFGTNLTAFLLDIDPATPVPEGASALRIVDFKVTDNSIRVELASDLTEFPEASGSSLLGTTTLGNGYFVLRYTSNLSLPVDDWDTLGLAVETRADGHAVVECPLDADESLRSASFFRPSISLYPPKMTIVSPSSHIIVVKPISSSTTSSSACRPASRPFRRSSSSVRSLRRFSPTTSPPAPVVEQ